MKNPVRRSPLLGSLHAPDHFSPLPSRLLLRPTFAALRLFPHWSLSPLGSSDSFSRAARGHAHRGSRLAAWEAALIKKKKKKTGLSSRRRGTGRGAGLKRRHPPIPSPAQLQPAARSDRWVGPERGEERPEPPKNVPGFDSPP